MLMLEELNEELRKSREEVNELNKVLFEKSDSVRLFERIQDDQRYNSNKINNLKTMFSTSISVEGERKVVSFSQSDNSHFHSISDYATTDINYEKNQIIKRIQYLEQYIVELQNKIDMLSSMTGGMM